MSLILIISLKNKQKSPDSIHKGAIQMYSLDLKVLSFMALKFERKKSSNSYVYSIKNKLKNGGNCLD